MLETKFDELVKYVYNLEEDNASLMNTVTQLQTHQEDLKNRECRQNLWIWGISESVGDQDLYPYILSLFNSDPSYP